MEVHALHIKITMIRCLPNLLDDFTALRGSWGGTVSADVSILARKWRLFHPWTASFLGQAAALRFRPLSPPKLFPKLALKFDTKIYHRNTWSIRKFFIHLRPVKDETDRNRRRKDYKKLGKRKRRKIRLRKFYYPRIKGSNNRSLT